MEATNNTAGTLVRALPYIRRFSGKTVVVKYGGNAMVSGALKAAVMQDVVLMACVGIRTVLVHGGGPEIDAALARSGVESRFEEGLRVTGDAAMEVVQSVLCGKLGKDIAALIGRCGGRAVSLCGIDGAVLKARRTAGGRLGRVGEVTEVDTALLNTLLDAGFIPVVAPVALDDDANADAGIFSLNVNADTAAAKIAGALTAEKLILMTDVPGVLRDPGDPATLVKTLRRDELDRLKSDGTVTGGMIPKTDCCAAALDAGVQRAHIIDGRVPHALLVELFTDEGVGTMVC